MWISVCLTTLSIELKHDFILIYSVLNVQSTIDVLQYFDMSKHRTMDCKINRTSNLIRLTDEQTTQGRQLSYHPTDYKPKYSIVRANKRDKLDGGIQGEAGSG